eukprot:s526_g30.t1
MDFQLFVGPVGQRFSRLCHFASLRSPLSLVTRGPFVHKLSRYGSRELSRRLWTPGIQCWIPQSKALNGLNGATSSQGP